MAQDRSNFSSSETLLGHGELIAGSVSLPLASVIVRRSLTDSTAVLSYEASVATDDSLVGALRAAASRGGVLQLRAECGLLQSIDATVAGMRFRARNLIEGELHRLTIRRGREGAVPAQQSLSIFLSASARSNSRWSFVAGAWAGPESRGLSASDETRDDQAILRLGDAWRDEEERAPFVARIGEALYELRSQRLHLPTTVEGSGATVAYTRCAFVRRLKGAECIRDVSALLDRIEPELNDICLLLSFLQRSWVDWTSVEEFFTGETPDRRFGESVIVRQSVVPSAGEFFDSLVNPIRMPVDAIDRLKVALEQSPIRDAVQAAMRQVVQSWQNPRLDYALVDVFTGLEILTNAWSEWRGIAHTLGSNQFKQLQRLLKSSIDAYGEEKNLNETAREHIVEKIAELRRAPFVPRLVALLSEYEVEVDDLWQQDWKARGQTLTDRLKALYKRRSVLIHTGELADIGQSRYDAKIVHSICERLLFRLLGGELGWIDSDVAWMHTQQEGRSLRYSRQRAQRRSLDER